MGEKQKELQEAVLGPFHRSCNGEPASGCSDTRSKANKQVGFNDWSRHKVVTVISSPLARAVFLV